MGSPNLRKCPQLPHLWCSVKPPIRSSGSIANTTFRCWRRHSCSVFSTMLAPSSQCHELWDFYLIWRRVYRPTPLVAGNYFSNHPLTIFYPNTDWLELNIRVYSGHTSRLRNEGQSPLQKCSKYECLSRNISILKNIFCRVMRFSVNSFFSSHARVN